VTDEWIAAFRQRRNLALERELVEIPGATFAVRALHRALDGRLAVASGADLHKVRMQLAKVGLLPYFEGHVFSGQDLPRSKPHPDVYQAAAASLGADPRRCAVIEDTVTGAAAGVAAGATVFGYSPGQPGHASAAALRETGAVHVFQDMRDLPALLAGWTMA
jgi:HAD superfamily hydrolase (TIGR01509 family)